MRLVSYVDGSIERVGVILAEYVVDVGRAELLIGRSPARTDTLKDALRVSRRWASPPGNMIELLGRGEEYLHALDVITGGVAGALAEKSGGPDREVLSGLLKPLASTRLLAPVPRPGKIVCLGMNYADHAREQGLEPPKQPLFFLKSGNTISATGDPIILPPNSSQVDFEAELAVVIGKRGRRIPLERAYEHVAGYMILNDVSARDMQYSDRQWFRGKSCDTFAPCGPWMVTADELGDPHRLRISSSLNGQPMQDSNTSNLIFKVDTLISYLSQSLTWEVGDIISTGTPPGVGVFRKPPVFLKPGDSVSISIERLGTLTNPVVGSDAGPVGSAD
ncbi:MAG TPA: fumarylacetoacetate hydrolase family protein [Terriglobia bacterium]|nr:fumarylacetoacetate hydrolase family protein [Terriglobia bacterium]